MEGNTCNSYSFCVCGRGGIFLTVISILYFKSKIKDSLFIFYLILEDKWKDKNIYMYNLFMTFLKKIKIRTLRIFVGKKMHFQHAKKWNFFFFVSERFAMNWKLNMSQLLMILQQKI